MKRPTLYILPYLWSAIGAIEPAYMGPTITRCKFYWKALQSEEDVSGTQNLVATVVILATVYELPQR